MPTKERYSKMNKKQKKEQMRYSKQWCGNNREKHHEYVRRSYWKVKKMAFEKLGNKCRMCDIDDPRILSVNHIHGQKRNKVSGVNLWRKVINDEFPLGEVDLLCLNCQHIYEYMRGNIKLPEIR